MSAVDTRGALEAVERILNRGGEPKEVVCAVLEALHVRGVPYAAVRLGNEEVAVGSPTSGVTSGPLTVATGDAEFVARLATLLSAYVPR